MKSALLPIVCLTLGMTAYAQVENSAGSKYTATERARIEAERFKERIRIEKAEAYCYQRFAVNNCLRDVAVERRKTMDELRRQEIILNNIDRKLRAGEQLHQIDEKQTNAISTSTTPIVKTPKPSNKLTQEQERQEEQAFRDKQINAQQHKDEREKEKAEKKGQSVTKPLPVPP